MPENRHGDARVHVEGGQERAAGAARVVDLDLPDLGLLAPRSKLRLTFRGSSGRPLPVVNSSWRRSPQMQTSGQDSVRRAAWN
jgi:hypothetical protein